MNFKSSILKSICFICFITILLILLSGNSKAQQLGSFGASGYVTFTPLTMADSLRWEKQNLIVDTFQGKKIKRILLQTFTGRVIVFFRRSTIEMDKETAIKDGLLPAPSVPVFSAIESIIDTPLYVGITNHIQLQNIDPEDADDLYIPTWEASFDTTVLKNEFIATFSYAGPVKFSLWSKKNKKPAYEYDFTVEHLPGVIAKGPTITVGDLDSLFVDAEVFKNQPAVKVTKGYTFESAAVYFSNQPFLNVYVAMLKGPSLTQAKLFMHECLPGSQITFSNVKVSDPSGKIITIPGCTYTLIDSSIENSGPRINYVVSYPEFIGGDKALNNYLQTGLTGYKNDKINNGHVQLFVDFKVMADGTIADIPDTAFLPKNSLERKCLDLIESGPKWIPGQYIGDNIDILFSYFINIDIKD